MFAGRRDLGSRLFGGELLQILGGVFVEVFAAAFAAEFNFLAFVDEGEGFFVEVVAGDDAGFERIRFGRSGRGAGVSMGGVVVFGGLAASEGDDGGDGDGCCDEE